MNQSGDKGQPSRPRITFDELHQHVLEGDGMQPIHALISFTLVCVIRDDPSHNSL